MENQTIPTPETQSQPISTPPVVNPPKKSYLPLILVVLVIFFISIFAGITLGKYLYSPQAAIPLPTLAPKPTAIPTIIPTINPEATQTVYTEDTRSANWKTYLNKLHNFQIKYPPELHIESSSDDMLTIATSDYQIDKRPGPDGGSMIKGSKITIQSLVPIQDEEGFIYNSRCKTNAPNDKRTCKTTMINSYKVTEVFFYNPDGKIKSKEAYIQSDKNRMVVFYGDISDPVNQSFSQIFDQILSTFKFTQ